MRSESLTVQGKETGRRVRIATVVLVEHLEEIRCFHCAKTWFVSLAHGTVEKLLLVINPFIVRDALQHYIANATVRIDDYG